MPIFAIVIFVPFLTGMGLMLTVWHPFAWLRFLPWVVAVIVAFGLRRLSRWATAWPGWWALLTYVIDALFWNLSERSIGYAVSVRVWASGFNSMSRAGWPFTIELPPPPMGADIPPLDMWPAIIGNLAVAGLLAAAIVTLLVQRPTWWQRWRRSPVKVWWPFILALLVHAFMIGRFVLWFD